MLGFHETLEDPREPGQDGPELTADGDHPSIEGYRLLGELVARRPRGRCMGGSGWRQAFGRRSSAGGSPDSP